MLALVDNQLAYIEPALDIQGGFSVEASKPDLAGKGRIYVRAGGRIIDSGVIFHIMAKSGDVTLDPQSGRFQVKRGGSAVFRAIFAGQHEDVEVKR
jgi:hypothetical protein